MRSKWRYDSLRIQADKLLWSVAMCCAVLLLFAPLTSGTTWVYAGAEALGTSSTITEGRGWALFVGAAGIVAICFLVISAITRQKFIIPSFCTTVTTVVFGMAALSSGYTSSNRATWSAALPEFTLQSADWSHHFVIIALIATVSSMGLTFIWLEPAQDEW